MYFTRTPHIARMFYPGLTWKIRDDRNNIYLTFDDGPDPLVTPDVIGLLEKFKAKATFFCVGDKVRQHPELFSKLTDHGHGIGNHTFNHLNGKKHSADVYVKNVEKAAELIRSSLFRPPYGRISYKQVRRLKKKHKIIMWSVLPGDFDPGRTREEVLNRALRHTTRGSIVVFHDNAKFKEKMLFALEGFLQHFSSKGFNFRAITEDII